MAESLGKAVLELAADHLGLDRDMKKAEGQVDKSAKSMGQRFKSGLKSAMVPAVAVLGTVGVAAKKSIDAASDVGEQMSKTGVVFGKAADDVHAWSKTTASSIGISQRAALEAAGVFGNMLVPMGFARGKAAEMSKGLVQLSADLASFNNADPEEVMDALRAGLSGETEPLRKFGVFLNQARIEQEALNKHLWNGKGNIDAQAKAAATMSIIMKDTKDAQGDFGRTASSAANQERIQAARTEDLNAKIGQGLLPAYKQLQRVLLAVTGFMAQHSTATRVVVSVIAALAAAVIAVSAGMKLYAAGAAVVTAAQWAWNVALTANPIGAVILAIVALIAAVVLIVKHWDVVKAATIAVWGAIRDVIGVVLAVVKGYFMAYFNAYKAVVLAVWSAIRAIVSTYLSAVKAVIETYLHAYKTVITAVWSAIRSVFTTYLSAVKAVVTTYFNAYKTVITTAWNAVKTATTAAWDAVKSAVSTAIGSITSLVRGIAGRLRDALSSLAGTLASVATSAFNKFESAARGVVGGTVSFVKDIPGRLKDGIGHLGNLLYEEGKALIGGLERGILDKFKGVLNKVKGFAGKIKSLKGPIEKDRVLLVDEGRAIIEGLGHGLDSEFRRLQHDVSGYAPTIQATFAQGAASGTSGPNTPGPLVNIENMEVRDAFDEEALPAKLAWRLQTA